jgi:hypothetical protein
MSMHEKAKARMVGQLLTATSPGQVDAVLDQLYDGTVRATEWDADMWGFDPDRWMEAERVELARRGGTYWPSEPALRRTA